jgi:hypothetical protein
MMDFETYDVTMGGMPTSHRGASPQQRTIKKKKRKKINHISFGV